MEVASLVPGVREKAFGGVVDGKLEVCDDSFRGPGGQEFRDGLEGGEVRFSLLVLQQAVGDGHMIVWSQLCT